MHNVVARGVCLSMALVVLSCSNNSSTGPGGGGSGPKAATVGVVPADTTVIKGRTYNLTAVVYDSTVTVLPGAPVVFVSADTSVAQVSSTGLVTAKGLGGTTVTATSGSAVTHVTVEVMDSVALGGSPFGAAGTKGGAVYILQHSNNQASRFTLPGTAPVTTFNTDGNPTYVMFDSAGTSAFITAQAANMVQVITTSSNTITDSIPVTGNPFVVRVSPDDKSIWVSTNVDSLYQISRSTKTVLAAYAMPLVPNGIAFNPANDSLLYAGTLTAGEVVEVNYKAKTIGRTFSPGGNVQAVAVSHDGTTLFVANQGASGAVQTYNLATGAAGASTSVPGGAFDLALSSDGTILWVTESQKSVRAYDAGTLTLLRRFKTGGDPRRLAVTPSGEVVVGNESGWVNFVR